MKIIKLLFEPYFLIVFSHAACVALTFIVDFGFFYSYRWGSLTLGSALISFLTLGFFLGLLVKPYFRLTEFDGMKLFTAKFVGVGFLSAILVFLSILDVFYSGGFPVQRLIGLPGPSSTIYGMPLVHGLQKAVQFLLFTFIVLNRNYWSIAGLILLLLPLLELSRSSLLIYFFIYFSIFFNQISARELKVFPLFTVAIFVLVMFVLMGNIRDTSALSRMSQGANLTFLWFYSYLVSPLANFSEIVLNEERGLIYTALNATTGWYPLYQIGGRLGLAIGAIAIGFCSGLLHGRVRARLLPFKVVFASGTAFLFFGNFLLNNAYLFMMVFLLIFGKVKFYHIREF